MKKDQSDIQQALQSNPLFQNMDDSQLKIILENASERVYLFLKGQQIFPLTNKSKGLCLLLKGIAETYSKDVLLNRFETGSLFGAASLFSDATSPYPTQIIAKTECTILYMDQPLIQKLIQNNSIFAMNYIRFLSERIRFLNKKIDSFTTESAVLKLSKYLKQQSKGNLTFDLPTSLTGVARILDIGRASLYRAFETLEQNQVILKTNRRIQILDPDKLR